MFTTWDWVIIGVYILIIVVLGVTVKTKGREDYLLADRGLGVWSSALTIIASKIGGGILLTYTALVYLYGLAGLWFFIGAVVGYLVFYRFAKHIKELSDQNKFYTLSDYYYHLFGNKAGKLAGLMVLTTMFGWVVVNLIGGAKILEQYGGISYESSVVAIGVIVLSYLLIGGFKAVVKTDIVQSVGIGLLFVLFLYIALTSGFSITGADLNLLSIPLFQIISFFLTGIFFPFASAELWQRVYAVKDQQTLNKTILATITLYSLFGLILALLMMGIRSTLPNLTPDIAFVNGLVELLPAGLVGLGAIVFYSAIMSSVDTYLFASHTSLTNDLISRGHDESKRLTLLSLSALTILGVVLAISLQNVIDTTFLFAALTMALGVITVIVWKFKKISSLTVTFTLTLNFFGILILAAIVGISTTLVLYSLGLVFIGVLLGQLYTKFKVRKLV